jgi:hypothetical protein
MQPEAALVPFSLVTLSQAEIQTQLQALKRRLAEALAAENSCSADQLLIGADLLLLLDKIKDTRCNNLLKQKALAYIGECQVELDGYHAHQETIAPYTKIPLKVAGRSLGQAIDLMLFSYT